jgi:hypothetical protein
MEGNHGCCLCVLSKCLLLQELLLRVALLLVVVEVMCVSQPDQAARGSQHHRCSYVISHVLRA